MTTDIIAWLINGVITNDKVELTRALKSNAPIDYICTTRAKFMADCDFGKQWEELAKLPVVFRIGKDGRILKPKPQPVREGELSS